MSILSSLFAPSPPPGWGIYRRNIYLKHFLTSLLHPLPIPSDQSSCVSLAGEHKHSHFVIPWPNPVSESLSRLTGVQRQEAGSSQSTTPPTSFYVSGPLYTSTYGSLTPVPTQPLSLEWGGGEDILLWGSWWGSHSPPMLEAITPSP